MHRQDFEGSDIRLQLLLAEQNAQARLEAHSLSPDDPHGGNQSERIVVKLTGGKTCLVAYPFGKTPVIDELSLTAWVKSNRPGVKILVRIVLPRDIDPETENPTWMWIEGETSSVVGRWDPIKVSRPREALVKQQGILQAARKAKVDVREAYADMLLLNIHTGVGVSDVSVDDLEIGPIVTPSSAARMDANAESRAAQHGRRTDRSPFRQRRRRQAPVAHRQGSLHARRPRLLHARHSPQRVRGGAPLERLREAQFNTVFAPWPIEPETASQAQQLGPASRSDARPDSRRRRRQGAAAGARSRRPRTGTLAGMASGKQSRFRLGAGRQTHRQRDSFQGRRTGTPDHGTRRRRLRAGLAGTQRQRRAALSARHLAAAFELRSVDGGASAIDARLAGDDRRDSDASADRRRPADVRPRTGGSLFRVDRAATGAARIARLPHACGRVSRHSDVRRLGAVGSRSRVRPHARIGARQ